MKLRSYWLPWALAAIVVLGYGGAAFAQAPTPGNTNPAGPPRIVPQGGVAPNIVPVSPEAQRKAEEHARKYGTTVFAPPHPAKHWPNGVPPERYHRTAPPTPSSGGERATELSRTSDLRA